MAELNREKMMENEDGVGEVALVESVPGQARNMDGGEIVEMLDERGGELEGKVEEVWVKWEEVWRGLEELVGKKKWVQIEPILRDATAQDVSLGMGSLILKHAVETVREMAMESKKKVGQEFREARREEKQKREKQRWEDEVGHNLSRLRTAATWEDGEDAHRWREEGVGKIKSVLEEIGREFSGVENDERAEMVVYWAGKMKSRLEEGGDFQMLVDDLGWWWRKVAMAVEET